MKTFETEKGNIPEGATHYGIYGCDTEVYFKKDNGVFLQWQHENWNLSSFAHHKWVKPIPQTNIETPEEKEALDSIDVKLIKPREPSKPVITKIEWGGAGLPPVGSLCKVNRDPFVYRVMYSSEYVVIVQNLDNDNTTAHGMDIILDLRKGDYTFSKPETPQQREEREREEFKVEMCKGLGIDAVGCNTACIINKLYELGYRKESE
ncbi:hypothetical protein NVP1197A_67 [Vibrio phage 1.197.A._10N.286.54.F2]|nr:hypothetical protein NVP1197A_67 [Vibrio phage 1.197.A._10N.286.54.F2]